MKTNEFPFYARLLFIIGIGVALAVSLDNIAIGIGVSVIFLYAFILRSNKIANGTETKNE